MAAIESGDHCPFGLVAVPRARPREQDKLVSHMPRFALDPAQPLAPQARQIWQTEAARAHQQLVEQPEGLDEALHETRKSLKRLRAFARLFRAPLGEGYEGLNTAARDAARLLSALRDHDARLESAAALRAHFRAPERDEAPFDALEAHLQRAREAARARLNVAQAVDEAAARIASLARAGQDWTFSDDLRGAALGGFARTYRRARRMMAACGARPTTEAFHEWRKHAKYHLQHLSLLEPGMPEFVRAQRKELSVLADCLGDEHDLAILSETLSGEGGSEIAQAPALLALMQRRRESLQSQAFALGRVLFAERSRAFAKRLARYWQAAQVYARNGSDAL